MDSLNLQDNNGSCSCSCCSCNYERSRFERLNISALKSHDCIMYVRQTFKCVNWQRSKYETFHISFGVAFNPIRSNLHLIDFSTMLFIKLKPNQTILFRIVEWTRWNEFWIGRIGTNMGRNGFECFSQILVKYSFTSIKLSLSLYLFHYHRLDKPMI